MYTNLRSSQGLLALVGYLIGTAFPVWVRIIMSYAPDTLGLILTTRALPWAIGALLVGSAVPLLARRLLPCLLLGLAGSMPFSVRLAFSGY